MYLVMCILTAVSVFGHVQSKNPALGFFTFPPLFIFTYPPQRWEDNTSSSWMLALADVVAYNAVLRHSLSHR